MIYGKRASVLQPQNGHFVEFARQPGTAVFFGVLRVSNGAYKPESIKLLL